MKLYDLLEHLEIQKLDEFRPAQDSHVVLVTGKMATPGLKRMMEAIDPQDFSYEIRTLDIQVAAWLTSEKIIEDFGNTDGVDLILIPGKTMGDEADIERTLGVQVMRGPGCYSAMPEFLEEKGFEQQVSDVPRPKLLVMGSDAGTVAEFVAKTFEVPFITPEQLIARSVEDGQEFDDPYRHNVLAELFRARLLEEDARRGYVLLGYPRNERDTKWLEEMRAQIDGVVTVGGLPPELAHYENHIGRIDIAVDSDAKNMQANAIERVEQMMQQCVVKTENLAP